MSDKIILSSLGHTWLLDLDGTIVKHNGYLIDGNDVLLEGAKQFIDSIPSEDKIIFLTSREDKYRTSTEAFLNDNNIRYDMIVYGLPYGERIVVNDNKPSGLKTGIAVNIGRDLGELPEIVIDKTI